MSTESGSDALNRISGTADKGGLAEVRSKGWDFVKKRRECRVIMEAVGGDHAETQQVLSAWACNPLEVPCHSNSRYEVILERNSG